MRYWVYKDAQIVGPLDREQLSTAVGLRADTLVCADDGGGRENDWRLAEDCPELSGLYYTASRAPAADMPLEEFGLLERLQFESGGAGEAEDWLGALFQGTPIGELKESKYEADGRLAVALKESQERVRELTEQVARLTRRLEELEASPRRRAEPAPAPAPVETAPPPVPLPVDSPPPAAPALPEMPSFAPPKPAEPPVVSAPTAAPPPVEVPAPAAPAAPAEPPAPAPAEPENPNRLKLGAPAKKGVQLGAVKSFKTVKKDPPAAAPAAGPAAPAPAPTPAASLPPMPTLQPAPSLPPITETPALAPPPAVTGWNTPVAATPIFSQPTPGLEAPPIPSMQPPAPAPAAAPPAPLEPPPLPVPPVPTADVPPATLVGKAAAPPAATPPGPATKEVLARLAKPAPKAETAPPAAPQPRSQKAFFIVAAVGILAFGVVGWLFVRNPSDVQQAVDMSPDAPLPEDDAGAPAPIPMAQVQAPEPLQQPAPQPQQQPAPEPPVMQDQGPAAIELVKGYPLDGDRGTIGQWLAYSFMSAPGGQDKWDAGAVEETTYLVQYTVLPKSRDAITYLFEADVARGTVMGKNPASRELLAGSSRPVVKKASVKRARKRRPAAAPKAKPRLLPQLPLPSDTELMPPSEDDGSFRSDAVEPGL